MSLWPLALWWECQSLPQMEQVHQLWWPWGGKCNAWILVGACNVTIRTYKRLFNHVVYCPCATSYQYFLWTWLFLWRLSMCSTTSSLLASRRAPAASFSSPRQGSSSEYDFIFIPYIILERTGSTEEMDVTTESSERQQKQMYSGAGNPAHPDISDLIQ